METCDHETDIRWVSFEPVVLVLDQLVLSSGENCADSRRPDFTRRPVKYERFIRPMGLRYKKANVTHPELGVTVQLPILGVKRNPQNPLYTQLGVLTKGTVLSSVPSHGFVLTPSDHRSQRFRPWTSDR